MKENMVNKIKNGIVWVRTPKCATSTMAVHLQNFCEDRKMKFTASTEHGSMAPTRYVNLGHLWEGMVNWNVAFREKRLVMGSIRNPLDRFLSHYKHHLRDGRYPEYGNNVSKFYLENHHNTHLESEFRGMDNYLSKYLGDKSKIKERYDFFTVSEYFNDSLEKLENIINYTFDNKSLVENKTDFNLIITDEFINLFEKHNKDDYELYDFVIKNYGYEK
jgi:hypothetical protein